ncbi:MAG: xcpT 2 [Chthoniobacteraceae bacterium]|nr:xcpT 2 [Chthoniobacteraceae bacterium]
MISLSPSSRSQGAGASFRAGFTLIELLTVIAIIAILMGLLFPVLNLVKEAARKAQARNDIAGLIGALKQYYTEYGNYPPLTDPSAASSSAAGAVVPDQFVGDLTQAKTKVENSMLMNTLRSIDALPNEKFVRNPKRIVFLDVKAVGNPEAPKGGILEKVKAGGGTAKPGLPVSNGCFLDPWGRQYFVMIDTNHDDLLDVGQLYGDFVDSDRPHTSVGVFAMGADNVIGTEKNPDVYRNKGIVSDDIISWQ